MYNKESTIDDLKLAVEDANKALERRPKDKFYNVSSISYLIKQAHKVELMSVVQGFINSKISFIKELVEKAEYQIQLQERFKKVKQ